VRTRRTISANGAPIVEILDEKLKSDITKAVLEEFAKLEPVKIESMPGEWI
jgi:hypothetical protein